MFSNNYFLVHLISLLNITLLTAGIPPALFTFYELKSRAEYKKK